MSLLVALGSRSTLASRLSRFGARSILVVLGAGAIAAGGACNRKPEVSFSLKVPGDVLDKTTWFEVGAYAGGSCPPLGQLTGGVPVNGAAAHVAFFRDAKVPPALGDIPRGSYAFAAVAKADDCSVLAGGCTVVDVGDSNDVSIALHAFDNPTGACRNGTVCQAAECVPSSDNSDPSVGASCSLDLLGAGPLGDPLAISGILTSAPAIVATSQGFLLVYREFDPLAGAARLTFQPIDSSGGALAPHQETLADRCSGSDESDAVGLSFIGDTGLAIVARAPCNGKIGFDFYAVDPTGNVPQGGYGVVTSPGDQRLLVSTAHGLAPIPGAKDYITAFTNDGQALLNTTSGVHFGASPASPFGGAPPHSGAWVATTDKIVALLAGATGTISGAGTDAGPLPNDGGKNPPDAGPPAPADDAGGPQPILRFNLAAAGANLASLEPPVEFPGAWGALAADGRRVVVASSGFVPGKPVAYRVFDLGQKDPTLVDGFNTAGLGTVLYSDVAIRGGRLVFAVEQAEAISLMAYDHADTTPTYLREIQFQDNPRIPSLKGLRDGRIAMAMSDNRVAVAWTMGRELTSNDAVGGYAVFACTGP